MKTQIEYITDTYTIACIKKIQKCNFERIFNIFQLKMCCCVCLSIYL